jgi:hypothetical protein
MTWGNNIKNKSCEEGERRESGEVVRNTTLGVAQEIISQFLKVLRQCPLVLLVEVMHMIGINFYVTLRGLHCIEIVSNTGRATSGRNCDVTVWRAACEACSATCNLGTNSAFALGPRKPTENLDRFWEQPIAYFPLITTRTEQRTKDTIWITQKTTETTQTA